MNVQTVFKQTVNLCYTFTAVGGLWMNIHHLDGQFWLIIKMNDTFVVCRHLPFLLLIPLPPLPQKPIRFSQCDYVSLFCYFWKHSQTNNAVCFYQCRWRCRVYCRAQFKPASCRSHHMDHIIRIEWHQDKSYDNVHQMCFEESQAYSGSATAVFKTVWTTFKLFKILDQECRETISLCPCSIWSICRLHIYLNTNPLQQTSLKAYQLANLSNTSFQIQICSRLKWRSVVQPHMFQNGIKKETKKDSCACQGTIKTASLVGGAVGG